MLRASRGLSAVGSSAWLLLAGMMALSCGSSAAKNGDGGTYTTLTWVFPETPTRDLDLLFMIDNSGSMSPMQLLLIDQLPAFMTALESLPGGRPNLHIAVVSSDMGAGTETRIARCVPGGDLGQFHFSVGSNGMMRAGSGSTLVPCTTTGLNAGQTFIENVAGVANYTGDISNVLGCIAGLGDSGCSFEHQIESVVRALGADGFAPPDTNTGFLRRNALLAIIFVTDEDDCSAPFDSQLFNFDDNSLGPLTSFRCNEYGHLCDGAPPTRTTARTYPAMSCHANPAGPLIPIETLAAQLKSLKDDPSRVAVAAIAGPPDPYATHLESSAAGEPQTVAIDHSCTQAAGLYADPGVRIADLVAAMGGVLVSACASSFAPALQQIAGAITQKIGPLCVPPVRVRGDGQPDCSVVERTVDAAAGAVTETPIPFCAEGSSASPCWSLVPATAPCLTSNLALTRQTPPLAATTIELSCTACAGADDPACMTRDR